MPLIARPSGVELLFIMRPATMPTHPSQVAFPGGALEPEDAHDTWRAALREAHEEVGLAPDRARRVARLDDLPTISDFVVTPWVAWIDPDAPLEACDREVDEVLTIPLAHLRDPGRRRTMLGRWRDTPRRLTFYLGDRHVVWGATAEMVTNLLRALG